MTTFLFANVLTSGLKIMLEDAGALGRRNRFIAAATFACGSACAAARCCAALPAVFRIALTPRCRALRRARAQSE
jgi:xanthine/uracil permease